MTDPQPGTETIIVHASPVKAQLEAGIRQVAASAAVILTTLGFTVLAGKAGLIVTLAPQIASIVVVVGPLIWAAATWVGQIATRHQAQKAATLAAKLPDEVARLK